MSHEQTSLRRLLTVAVLAVGAFALAAPAHAQATGSTDVDITIPDIVILHYYGNVDISITSGDFGTFLLGAGSNDIDEGIGAPAAGGFTQDLAISPSALTGDASAAVLTLQNAWAVRAVSLGGGASQTQLAITVPDATLDHVTTAATMTISSAAVDDGSTNGPTITFNSPGLAVPETGDVELTLDMTNSSDAGEYQDGVYTLTATNI